MSNRLDIWIYIPSVGKSGGILFGEDSTKIEIVSHSTHRFFLDVHLINKTNQTNWHYTIVYGPVLRSLNKLQTRKFTWASGRNFALLDRYFTLVPWDQHYQHSLVLDISKNGSYHCPLLLQITQNSHHQPSQFRIDPLWLEQEEFCRLVVKWWRENPL